MSKFAPLIHYLEENSSNSTVTFVDIEQILGFKLPKSAFTKTNWWKKRGSILNRPWINAGWEIENVTLGESVTFIKSPSFKKCTTVEDFSYRFKDLRTYGCTGFMYLNSLEFYEINDMILTENGFFMTFFGGYNNVRLQYNLEISNFIESIFDFEFEALNARFLLYKEIDEKDKFIDEFDDDYDDYNFLVEETIHCHNCGKPINFTGECYCSKNSISVTISRINTHDIYIFNEFYKEAIDYLPYNNLENAIKSKINNNDKYTYFKDIVLQDKGLYIEDKWLSINEFLPSTQSNKELSISEFLPSTQSNKEFSLHICTKCGAITKIDWNETKWLCSCMN